MWKVVSGKYVDFLGQKCVFYSRKVFFFVRNEFFYWNSRFSVHYRKSRCTNLHPRPTPAWNARPEHSSDTPVKPNATNAGKASFQVFLAVQTAIRALPGRFLMLKERRVVLLVRTGASVSQVNRAVKSAEKVMYRRVWVRLRNCMFENWIKKLCFRLKIATTWFFLKVMKIYDQLTFFFGTGSRQNAIFTRFSHDFHTIFTRFSRLINHHKFQSSNSCYPPFPNPGARPRKNIIIEPFFL